MAQNYDHPNHNGRAPRAGITQYLLGLGPMPPPTPQEMVVAGLQAALDGGAFAEPWNHAPFPIDGLPVAQGNQQIRQDVPAAAAIVDRPQRKLDVCLPYGCGSQSKDDPPVITILNFNIDDISPEDFLSRVHATIGVDAEHAKLGWKSCDQPKRNAFNRLATHDDVKNAFAAHAILLDSKRRRKPVFMEIANLQKLAKQEKPALGRATYSNELKKVKAKLSCAQHPGTNRWCYIRRDAGHEGEHIALGLEEIGLWARSVHNGMAGEDCLTPPDILNLDEVASKAHACVSRSILAQQSPSVSMNCDFGPVFAAPSRLGNSQGSTSSGSTVPDRKCKHSDMFDIDADSDSDDELDPIPINNVLNHLEAKTPAFNFPQYKTALVSNGIVYARSIVEFEPSYYKNMIGMADGAIGEFIRVAKRMLKKQGKEKARELKRARLTDKENSESMHV